MKQLLIPITVFASSWAMGQNVGIGTNTPTKARLVVSGTTANAQAIFGEGQDGISLETGSPLVGFNNYFLGGRKFMANGYAGSISMNSTTGNFSITTYGTGTAGSSTPTSSTLVTILQSGNVGIGNTNPTFDLDVSGTLRITTKATFGTTVQITGGAPAANKVLTATDALGNAVWTNPVPVNNNTGFRETVTTSTTIATGAFATVPFTNITTATGYFDDGPNLNNATNAYVAPANGVYQFDLLVGLNAGTVAGSGSITLIVLVNGFFNANLPPYGITLAGGDAIPSQLRFGSFLLKLTAGEAVAARVINNLPNSITINTGLGTQFSGVRIY